MMRMMVMMMMLMIIIMMMRMITRMIMRMVMMVTFIWSALMSEFDIFMAWSSEELGVSHLMELQTLDSLLGAASFCQGLAQLPEFMSTSSEFVLGILRLRNLFLSRSILGERQVPGHELVAKVQFTKVNKIDKTIFAIPSPNLHPLTVF